MSGKRTAWMLAWFILTSAALGHGAVIAVIAEQSVWPVFPIGLIAGLIFTAAMEDAPR